MAVEQDRKSRSPATEITRSRREREKLKRRESIITAARALFYTNGYQATTMEDIAASAEVSKGTLYLYFGSKDELYVSIVRDGFMIINEQLEEVSGSGSELFEKGRLMFLGFARFCLENREYFRMTQYLLSETARQNLPQELVESLSASTTEMLGYVARLVAEGQEAGRLRREIDPLAFAVIAWRTATGLLDLALVDDSSGRAAGEYIELFERAYELLVDGARQR